MLDGHGKVSVETVPDPKILNPRDAIVRVTSTCICGSDLHLYDGFIPTMEQGDILGHEFMGEVVEVGPGSQRQAQGRRPRRGAVSPSPAATACSASSELWSCCDNSNPNAWMPRRSIGYSRVRSLRLFAHAAAATPAGRRSTCACPIADVGPLKMPDELTDEQVLFLSDIFPTGYYGRGELQHQAGRHRRRLGLRPGRTVRDSQRASCWGPSA